MARNEEKAQSLLNRWMTMKQSFTDTFKGRRPYLASECDNLKEAEHFRRQIVREISKKVSDIQNAGSGEHVIRDLNDQINKRIREKYHWEKRIIELGGPDYTKSVAQHDLYEADGAVLQGAGGYKYFGAARNLPGVRELFEKEQPTAGGGAAKRSREELSRHITVGYYPNDQDDPEDEDEQQLLALESAEERKRIRKAIEEFDRQQEAQQQQQRELVGTS